MRRRVSMFLVVLLLLTYAFTTMPMVHASKKAESSRAIAIVFDNSGSMYIKGEKAWCRATYAMEVFASMLNKGDVLQIYPMHPITVNNTEYTMNKPFTITDAAQAPTIRNIYTKKALGTPIESVDAAANGVKKLNADKKYMIVLTDGDLFYKNGSEMSASATKKELDARFKNLAGEEMTVMYLGVGKKVVMPDTEQSKYFVKKQAKNSEDTLSALTEMCNQIFGRDTLPKSHLSEKNMKIDLSISKLIVFVQGENVSDLKVVGSNGDVGKQESIISTKYGTAGCGNYKSVPDTSLQGMMVTFSDCVAGNYTIEYKGNATDIEVYYEPNADLDFVFTDAEGNMVNLDTLYEGDYKVSFGMKDAKTGQLISSELLGDPHYEGSYFINGEEHSFSYDGKSGEVPIALKMNDAFKATLTVTYLSGYTITKNSSDFGWPDEGINVVARPAGDLKLKITDGDGAYSLQKLEKGKPYKAEIYYQGKKLTGKELEKVQLKWDPNTSYAEIKQQFAEDHYKLTLHYKNSKKPADTVCGKCKVAIHAFYSAQGSKESKAQATLSYKIEDDFVPIRVDLVAPDDYIVIADLKDSRPMIAKITAKGKLLSAEEFKSVTLDVDCSGIEYKITPNAKDSSFLINLLSTKGLSEADYPVKVKATYTDQIGRKTQAEDALSITLSNTPLWVKWLVGILILLLLLFIIWKILHIRVLPKRVRQIQDDCNMSVLGRDVNESADFNARLSGKQLSARTEYNGNNNVINISNVKPGKESYLYKPQHKRSMIIDPQNVRALGDVTYADVGGIGFKFDKNEGRLVPEDLEQTPFMLSNNSSISIDGTVEENGRTKKFHAEIPLTFKK